MSAATIDHTTDETAVTPHDLGAVDVTAWIDHAANLRRAFTGTYVPRHRADGPAR
jgi:hypothetical protein